SDQCHVAGACDPASGVCSDPAAPDGVACVDIVTCSGQDTCQAGVCSVPGVLVQKIAYVSSRDNPTGTPPTNFAEIYLLNPDDPSNRVRLTENADGDVFPALSPDGKGRIAFDSNRNRASGDPLNLSDLFLMQSDGTNPQYLVRGSSATWSADSQRIAFHRSASGTGLPINTQPGAPAADSDIFVARVCDLRAGVAPTNITNSPTKIDVDADWSNDGQKIVFSSSNAGDNPLTPTSSEIWVMNPDGSGVAQQLTINLEEERAPAWSPDGTRITYMCRKGGSDFEICVMNADGTGQTQLTFNTVNDATPSYSPDGTKIVFQRAFPPTGQQLMTMNPDGTSQTQLTDVPGINIFANWGFIRE
ncbi:MAG: TolB family protein, partial [Thermoanaerobaculia bacterium]